MCSPRIKLTTLSLFLFMTVALFLTMCRSKSTLEDAEKEASIVGPVDITEASLDVGAEKNTDIIPTLFSSQKLPRFIEEHMKMISSVGNKLQNEILKRYEVEDVLKKEGTMDLIMRYQKEKIVLNCSDSPYLTVQKLKGRYYTLCGGIELFSDGNEGIVAIGDGTNYFNRTARVHFSRTAFYIGDDTLTTMNWNKLKSLSGQLTYYPNRSEHQLDEVVTVITCQDWGNFSSSVITGLDQKNYLSYHYGENKVYSPQDGVLIYETCLDATPEKFWFLESQNGYAPVPRKYYAFILAVNNRITISGHTQVNYQTTSPVTEQFSFDLYDRRVSFYKNFLKQIDYEKLSHLTRHTD